MNPGSVVYLLPKTFDSAKKMFPHGFFWGAVFGAVGGVIILCLNHAWRMNFFQDHQERICLAAVFGAIVGMIAVLWSNALWRTQEAEAGEIADQYEEPQKQAVEHDERFP